MNKNVAQDKNEVREFNEVLDIEVLLSESSLYEGMVGQHKKTTKAIQRAHENDEANVDEPFYILQAFSIAKKFKYRVKFMLSRQGGNLNLTKMTRIGSDFM
ncbi:unnamed protein product [Lactuca saligna]|uniref:Uncharacterized protein n=1 Tax=Lactuca saligna TaxID=75948 RepID=A0AA35YQL1_LACSI|nr:unnamed protein product [Lactuca saligna]